MQEAVQRPSPAGNAAESVHRSTAGTRGTRQFPVCLFDAAHIQNVIDQRQQMTKELFDNIEIFAEMLSVIQIVMPDPSAN